MDVTMSFNNASLDTLPSDIIGSICRFLPVHQIALLGEVCKRFYYLDWSALGLQTLDLSYYYDAITDEVFGRLLDKFNKPEVIKRLNIAYCVKLTVTSLELIATTLRPTLEWLSIYNCNTLYPCLPTYIPCFSNLKFIDARVPGLFTPSPSELVRTLQKLANTLEDFRVNLYLRVAPFDLSCFPKFHGRKYFKDFVRTYLSKSSHYENVDVTRELSLLRKYEPDNIEWMVYEAVVTGELPSPAPHELPNFVTGNFNNDLLWLYSRLITDSDSKKVLDAQTKLHNEKRFERLKQKYIKRPFRGTVVQEVYICYDQLQVDAFNEWDREKQLNYLKEGFEFLASRLPVDPTRRNTTWFHTTHHMLMMKQSYGTELFSCKRYMEAYNVLKSVYDEYVLLQEYKDIKAHGPEMSNIIRILYRLSQLLEKHDESAIWGEIFAKMFTGARLEEWKKTDQCIRENRCTREVWGTKYISQYWFQCADCHLTEHYGICAVCAITDHADHRVWYEYFSESCFCDCTNHKDAEPPEQTDSNRLYWC